MTPTETIYARLTVKPKSTLLVGSRDKKEFLDMYFPKTHDVLVMKDFSSQSVGDVSHFSSLAPRGDSRLILIENLCTVRRDVQSTLLKMIEDSPERTFWVSTVIDTRRILEPVISRSFLLDWVKLSEPSEIFSAELKKIVENKNYLDIFKLHSKISEMAGKDSERIKELHLSCISELMFFVSTETASKLQRFKREIAFQNKTEISFKSALLEVCREI